MSTKTTFKRIALVAVAALGLGVLSVAPSQAAITSGTLTYSVTTGATASAGLTDSTTAAIISVEGLLTSTTDTITVKFINKGSRPTAASGYTVPANANMGIYDTKTANAGSTTKVGGRILALGAVTTGATSNNDSFTGKYVAATNEVETSTAGGNEFTIRTSSSGYVGARFWVNLDSVAAPMYGSYNYTALITSYSYNSAGTLTQTDYATDFTITVAKSTSLGATPSAAYSFANLTTSGTAAGTATATDAVITAVATASATPVGYVFVGNRNASGGYATAEDSITAVLTGAGQICTTSALGASPTLGVCGKSIKVAAVGDVQFAVVPDGTAGTASIAVSSSVAGWTSTKSLTFYAKAAKTLTASVFTPILAIGGNDSAVVVSAVDANGTNWTGTAYIVASSATDALVGGSATTPVACVLSTDKTKQYCPITTIAAGTAKFKVIDASTVALATATSAELTVTSSVATAASVKIAFDKATYAPGEKAVVTVTPVDASGNKIAKVSSAALLQSAITSNSALTISGTTSATVLASSDAAAITTSAYDGTDKTAGTYSIVVYMPQASGTITLSSKGGTALPLAGQVTVTASADVVNASVDAATDAANQATDAANAATDAALAAADAADAATAAAQDASDAVAALSASVEKLVASLKAQITSLTNLVIKIQKKVKA